MPTLKLKNASTVTIHGKRPGQVFSVETDKDGIPLEMSWRNRLRDERDYALGHIVRVDEIPVGCVADLTEQFTPAAEKISKAASLAPVPKRAKASPASSEPTSAPAEKE